MRPPLILRIFKDQQLIEVKQFDQDQIIVGNGGDVNLSLADPQVAAIHCLIELREAGYYISDLGSRSGTFKNTKQILDEPLSSGDQIGIGPFLIHFFVGIPKVQTAGPAVAAPPPAPEKAPKVSQPPMPSVPLPTPPKLPEVAKVRPQEVPGKSKKSKRGRKTFAPASEIQDLRQYLKPTKGPIVEVVVAWRERVIATAHFRDEKKMIFLGPSGADIEVPSSFLPRKVPFIDLSNGCRVQLLGGMVAEVLQTQQSLSMDDLVRLGKVGRTGQTIVRVDQGDLLCLTMGDGTLQIFIRYIPNVDKPLVAGLDLSASELTGLIVSFVLVSLVALYMTVYAPPPGKSETAEDTLRLVQFVYNKPVPPPPAKKVELSDSQAAKKQPTVNKPMDKAGSKVADQNVKEPTTKAAEVRPIPGKVNRPKKFTSVKQGGSVKMGTTESAGAQSRDVTKTGLLGAFGGGGIRSQLDQAYSGTGELLGQAGQATGTSGMATERAGDDLGSRFKDAGAGGKGTATEGIAGVGTKGRSSGQSAYGSEGFGGKGSVRVEPGGDGEEFIGKVDREAVRRVVRSILNQIKSCYERQYRANTALEGKVTIHWEVHEQGRVQWAKPKDTSPALLPVAECVAARIKEQRFPDPPAGSYYEVASYPFVFGPQR